MLMPFLTALNAAVAVAIALIGSINTAFLQCLLVSLAASNTR